MVQVEPIMLMYAFRYALGRRTYCVTDVASALIAHKRKLRPDWRDQIIRDIEERIASNTAGDNCDIEKWLQVVDAFRYDGR